MKLLAASIKTGGITEIEFLSGPTHPHGARITNTREFAIEGRSSYVQKMAVFESGGLYLAVARKGPTIQIYDLKTLKMIKEWTSLLGFSGEPLPVISVQYREGYLYTCNVLGKIVIRDWPRGNRFGTTKIPHFVSVFKLHPLQRGVVVYGGKQNDLEVAEISAEEASSSWLDSRLGPSRMTASSLTVKLFKIWKAKNIKLPGYNDWQPVWISDCVFLDVHRPAHRGWKIAAVTRYGEFRLYDTAKSRRPIVNSTISPHPLVSIQTGGDLSQMVCTDIQESCFVVDSITGNVLKKYKWKAGGLMVSDLYIPQTTFDRRRPPVEEEAWTPYDHLSSNHGLDNSTEPNNSQTGGEELQVNNSFSGSRHSSSNLREVRRRIDLATHAELQPLLAAAYAARVARGLRAPRQPELQDSPETSENSHSCSDSSDSSDESNDDDDFVSIQDSAPSNAPVVISGWEAGSGRGNRIIRSIIPARSQRPQTDRSLIACGGLDNYIRIYDIESGILQSRVEMEGRISAICLTDPRDGVERREDNVTEATGSKRISREDVASGRAVKRRRET